MTVSEVLAELEQTLSARAATHGDAGACFTAASQMWSVVLGHPITRQQVAVCMALLKVARQATGDAGHVDHMLDAAGYAVLAASMGEGA